jgi:delta24(24(1))-sterol reductase
MYRWNAAGVPLVYCAQSVYIYSHPPVDMHPNLFIAILIVLTIAYYIFDTANSQKNRFRMMMSGTYIPRHTFPQLPWGTITNPKCVTAAPSFLHPFFVTI